MKKPKLIGHWYHSGTNSFDYPMIKQIAPDDWDPDVQFGPYRTWESAKRDLEDMVYNDIQNLIYLRSNVRLLKKDKP